MPNMKLFGKTVCLLLTASLFFLIPVSKIKAAGQCDCNDCANLNNRYRQINALLAEICSERDAQISSGKYSQPFDMGEYNSNYLSSWVSAMGSAKNQSGMKATLFPSGNTDGFCNPSFSGYGNNACMFESVKTHESQHVQTCKFIFKTQPDCASPHWLDFFNPGYGACMTWGDYYTDEVNAYNKELDYLRSEIERLRPICKAYGGWCLSPDPGLEPTKCPPTRVFSSLIIRFASYLAGR